MEPWRENLSRLIERRGVTKVAQALGAPEATISRYKTGARWPSPGMLVRLCRELNVSADSLLGLPSMADSVAEPVATYGAAESPAEDARRADAALELLQSALDDARALLLGPPGQPNPQEAEEIAQRVRKRMARKGKSPLAPVRAARR